MSSKGTSTKDVLKDHSQAKVAVYTHYLDVYLRIMGYGPFSRIHLHDVLCGEGYYKDGTIGSAIAGLQTVSKYFSEFPTTKLQLQFWLNDAGTSHVEEKVRKIDRVKKHAEGIALPSNSVQVRYTAMEYDEILHKIEQDITKLSSAEKALIFIDPWGYKSIRPKQLKLLFAAKRSEILLFLPTTFMYRFANTATKDIPEHKIRKCYLPLKRILEELFGNDIPKFSSYSDFSQALKLKLAEVVGTINFASFELETNNHNKYTLFFFTPHILGLEVFNEACWKLDSVSGRQYSMRNGLMQMPLFSAEHLHFEQVKALIFNSPVTNTQLYEFGVRNQYLIKTTNAAITTLRKNGEVDVTVLDGLAKPRLNANYLDHNPRRKVQFKKAT